MKKTLVKVWGDVISLYEFLGVTALTLLTTFSLYFLAPSNHKPLQLLFGLIGAVIGFIISSIAIKPKRVLQEQNNEH